MPWLDRLKDPWWYPFSGALWVLLSGSYAHPSLPLSWGPRDFPCPYGPFCRSSATRKLDEFQHFEHHFRFAIFATGSMLQLACLNLPPPFLLFLGLHEKIRLCNWSGTELAIGLVQSFEILSIWWKLLISKSLHVASYQRSLIFEGVFFSNQKMPILYLISIKIPNSEMQFNRHNSKAKNQKVFELWIKSTMNPQQNTTIALLETRNSADGVVESKSFRAKLFSSAFENSKSQHRTESWHSSERSAVECDH